MKWFPYFSMLWGGLCMGHGVYQIAHGGSITINIITIVVGAGCAYLGFDMLENDNERR